MRQLKRQLAMERKTASQLRGNLVRSQLSRSELENFFLHALEVGTNLFFLATRHEISRKEKEAGGGGRDPHLRG